MLKKIKLKFVKSFIDEYFDEIVDYVLDIAKTKGEDAFKSFAQKLKAKFQWD